LIDTATIFKAVPNQGRPSSVLPYLCGRFRSQGSSVCHTNSIRKDQAKGGDRTHPASGSGVNFESLLTFFDDLNEVDS
jgi:hypothetical protein